MRIELYGQPIVKTREEKGLIGTEVLFRMTSATPGQIVSPLYYVGAAPGSIMPWFMDATVMGMLVATEVTPIPGRVFVNVSAETLEDNRFFDAWLSGARVLCDRAPVGGIVFEISERCELQDDAMAHRLSRLREVGGLVALDDYPDGSCGDSSLKVVAWDFVKVCAHACSLRGLDLETVLKQIRRLQPQAQVIVERIGKPQLSVTTASDQVVGLQSFETGMPAPLALPPYMHDAKGARNEIFHATGRDGHRRLAGAEF